jgi:hypothetical protein
MRFRQLRPASAGIVPGRGLRAAVERDDQRDARLAGRRIVERPQLTGVGAKRVQLEQARASCALKRAAGREATEA